MNRNISVVIAACVACYLCGMLGGYLLSPKEKTCTSVEESGIIITSVINGTIVHSRIWIDASFPEGTTEKNISINGVHKANYTPYLWNNIHEKAGTYRIKVAGRHKGNKTSETSINVIIPTTELFVGDRNNFTEDHVIHAGQNITWINGVFNLSSSGVDNGGGLYEFHMLDIYGNLTMRNVTLLGVGGKISGGIPIGTSRVNVRGNGVLIMINCTLEINLEVYAFDNSVVLYNNTLFISQLFGNGTVINI